MLDSISDPGSWYTYMAICCDFDENIYSFSRDGHVRHIINTVLVGLRLYNTGVGCSMWRLRN